MSEAADQRVAAALEALGNPIRREIYERILTCPSSLLFLTDTAQASRAAVSHHVRVLKSAGLVRADGGVLVATTDVLPMLRVYFDRLWFEASVGEGWLRDRFNTSDRLQCQCALEPAEALARSA